MNNKRAQQEIAGFVLIVVVVIIGLLVFLLISASKNESSSINSLEVENILSSVLDYTTKCATVREPDYDTFQDLFNSCNQDKKCVNLGKESCDYLNESLTEVLESIFEKENTVSLYQFDFYENSSNGNQGKLRIIKGECNSGRLSSAIRNLGRNDLSVTLTVCYS